MQSKSEPDMLEGCASDLFLSSETVWDCPPLTPEKVAIAEERLGVKLPRSYLLALSERNGGMLRRNTILSCIDSTDDPLSVVVLNGIGGELGIDTLRNGIPFGRFMVKQWGYPEKCISVSQFHTAGLLLDYSRCGPEGDPSILHAEADRPRVEVIRVADNFQTFLDSLIEASL